MTILKNEGMEQKMEKTTLAAEGRRVLFASFQFSPNSMRITWNGDKFYGWMEIAENNLF